MPARMEEDRSASGNNRESAGRVEPDTESSQFGHDLPLNDSGKLPSGRLLYLGTCRKANSHTTRPQRPLASRRLMERHGIGPISASALLASIGGGHDFKNGRRWRPGSD